MNNWGAIIPFYYILSRATEIVEMDNTTTIIYDHFSLLLMSSQAYVFSYLNYGH